MQRSPSSNSSLKSILNTRFPRLEPSEEDAFLKAALTNSHFNAEIITAIDEIPQLPAKVCTYEPKTFIQISEPYPKEVDSTMMEPNFISNFDLSTLLYIFYYFPMTESQMLSAKELQVRGWRYQTNCQTWFLRVSEPKEKTSEYEVADFLYFDHYSNSWCIRKRYSYKFYYECE